MRHRLLHVFAIVSAASTMLFAAPAQADDLSNQQQQQQQLNGQIGRDNQQIQQLQGQQAALQAQLDQLEGQIAAAQADLANQNAKLDAILGQIDETQRELEATRQHLAQRQQVLDRRERSLYKSGGDVSFIDSMFTASTFSQLLDRFLVMRDVTHADQLLVQQIQADKASIEQLAAQQARDRDAQKQVVDGIQQRQEALRGQYVTEAALKGQLASQQASVEQQRAAAQAALRQVNAEIASLVAARARAHSSGVFAWPGVQGPITQPFGCTDFAGEPPPPPGYSCPSSRPYFHTGIDIAGPFGSEIDAADAGIAYTYSSNSGYGNHVIIVHQNGYATLYGHMSSFAITSGQSVAKGQRIGYEGSTGFSSGPHLHFEIRLNDAPQDPCRYVGC